MPCCTYGRAAYYIMADLAAHPFPSLIGRLAGMTATEAGRPVSAGAGAEQFDVALVEVGAAVSAFMRMVGDKADRGAVILMGLAAGFASAAALGDERVP